MTEPHTTMTSEQFQVVQRLFKQISREPWFSSDVDRQQKFGAFLIRAYQGGNVDLVHLHDLALRTARERFSDVH